MCALIFSILCKNGWLNCFKELYSFLSPYLKDFEAQRCASFGRLSMQTLRRIWARKSCYSGKLKVYILCLWWTARQHHGYSSRDYYQDIQTSYHHALPTHSFRHQVHISSDSIGPNSEKARETWRLAIPWPKGGDGVVVRGSVVIGGVQWNGQCSERGRRRH